MGIFSSKPSWYVPRHDWDAVDPHATFPLHHPVPQVCLTAVEGLTYLRSVYYIHDCIKFLRELQKKEMYDEGLSDIAYNFYVGGDGSVYEGRGWFGAPTLQNEHSHNSDALAIAYIRPIPGSRPTKLMISKVKDVIDNGVHQGYIDENYTIAGLVDEQGST